MKEWFKKITGIKKIEEEKARLERERVEALAKAEEAKVKEELAKLTPKERATKKQEPWVAVLDTHVNKENIRNGFFELDWNSYFIDELKKSGYGFDGDPDEEIVDRWFRDLAANMLAEAGQDPSRATAGFINVTKLPNNRSQIE
jgi:uncharacterized membrane-anchored protein